MTGGIALEAKQAGRSPWVGRLARLGLVAKGVSYVLVAALAIEVALEGGRLEDRPGALRTIGQDGAGRVLLVALAVGFAAYAVWRLAQAFLDRDDEGTGPKGLGKRLGYLGRSAIYLGLLVATMSILLGEGGGSGNKEDKATAGVLDWELAGWNIGKWLVIAVGVGVGVVAAYNVYRALTRKFREKLKSEEMADAPERAAVGLGIAGMLARAVVFGITSWFLIQAAVDYRPQEAVGLDGALSKVAQQPYGTVLLGIVSAGLLAYGLYTFFEARYRHV
jgi:Domain of Unknown Function (DUF1206)